MLAIVDLGALRRAHVKPGAALVGCAERLHLLEVHAVDRIPLVDVRRHGERRVVDPYDGLDVLLLAVEVVRAIERQAVSTRDELTLRRGQFKPAAHAAKEG
eukprot:5003636-Prymnesium_polylepis.2